jgi:5-methylcytosine-specific restriction protein B
MFKIWKVSHGFKNIDSDASDWLDDHKYLTVHVDTLKGQSSKFRSELAIGDYVCLSRSSDIFALVRVTGDVVKDDESPLSQEWMLRNYEDILRLPVPKAYSKAFKRGWTPNYNSTIFSVDASDNAEFEKEILLPYFGLNLASLDNNLQSTRLSVDAGMDTKKLSLNSILFGPPGTGKTFNTTNYALSILEPDLDVNNIDRKTLKEKYDDYCKAGRIHFVTFHQSFSYEDFIEGLKASSEGGGISYSVEPGIFLEACLSAKSLPGSSLNTFDIAIEKLIGHCEKIEGRLEIETVRKKKFSIEYSGGGTFKVYPHSTVNQNPNYVASIDNVRKLYVTGSKSDLYNSSYVRGLLNFLKTDMGLPEYVEVEGYHNNEKPVVLIIDEINRGNISSIFGELITLIEPSKRRGAEEQLSVILPYSKDTFSIPNNLHLIGTMNTADRSLALMDTALRRRFDFIEMMPDLEVLKGINVNGIDIPKMLEKMNQRIEVLYDREHTLGHAFFIPLKEEAEDKRFNMLQGIFKNKILPLLEEYFFEDWEKIRLVLGDNQKQDQGLVFISIVKNNSIGDLFGNDEEAENLGLDEIITYQRNDAALGDTEAYKGIYGE